MSDANGVNPKMWRECIPPQTGSPVVVDAVVTDAEPKRRVLFFTDLFAWWRNARERKLRAKIARLEVRCARAEEERDQLAAANEMMRQWVLASTATAATVIVSLGGREKPSPPEKPKRTGGAYG